MLLNSLFGILIVPEENLDILDSVNIEFLQSKYRGDAKNFFRHMRNSLSHGHFINGIMVDSETKEIVSIKFKDIDNERETFDITLNVNELNELITHIKAIF